MKNIFLIVLIAAIFSSAAVFFQSDSGGDVNTAKTRDVASEMYTQEDIESAVHTIITEFDRHWSGCTLNEIYYAGDEESKAYIGHAASHRADEVIVLLSSFDVDESGGNGSLNPMSTYNNWMWILVRSEGGKWKHVDHGY